MPLEELESMGLENGAERKAEREGVAGADGGAVEGAGKTVWRAYGYSTSLMETMFISRRDV